MNNRISYLDAMRGLAMFLVVFVHVEGFCFFNFSHISFLGSMISLVHLPLFFFISGFFAFKVTKPTGYQLVNKVRTLLVPMCIIGLIYVFLVLKKDLQFFIIDTAKAGYWFTLVLFQMYLIYYGIKYLAYKFFPSSGDKWIYILIVLSFLMYLGKYPMRKIEVLDLIGNVSSLHYTMNYFQFFVLGMFLVRYQKSNSIPISKYIHTRYVGLSLGIIFLISAYYKYYMLDKGSIYVGGIDKIFSMLIGTFCGYCGVLGLYLLFKSHQHFFSEETKLGLILKSIGSRTLDIYLLHYFFLYLFPLSMYASFLQTMVGEIFIAGFITLIVIGCSLLLSAVIKKNALMSSLLLGVKKEKES